MSKSEEKTSPGQRHRQSVSLLPATKKSVDRIAAKKGVSANRAIEDAVRFYSNVLSLQKEDVSKMTLTMSDQSGNEEKVTFFDF